MKIVETALPEVKLIEPKVFGDDRGFFLETYSRERYAEALGTDLAFVQDNMSRSGRGTIRGMHLQLPHAQGKLVWVVEGAVLDVAIDVRIGSPRFGTWAAVELSAANKRQLWIPPGFAHGFAVTSEHATFVYKCTDLYHPEHELGVAFDDPELGIPWPIAESARVVSAKDRGWPRLASIDRARFPRYEVSA